MDRARDSQRAPPPRRDEPPPRRRSPPRRDDRCVCLSICLSIRIIDSSVTQKYPKESFNIDFGFRSRAAPPPRREAERREPERRDERRDVDRHRKEPERRPERPPGTTTVLLAHEAEATVMLAAREPPRKHDEILPSRFRDERRERPREPESEFAMRERITVATAYRTLAETREERDIERQIETLQRKMADLDRQERSLGRKPSTTVSSSSSSRRRVSSSGGGGGADIRGRSIAEAVSAARNSRQSRIAPAAPRARR